MNARPFLVPVAVFVAGLVAINVVIDPVSANSFARVHFDTVGRASAVTDLFLGSSVVANSVDPQVWDARRPNARAFNAGFNATFSVEHDILLRQARHLHPANIYYGFSDLELSVSAADTNSRITMYSFVLDSLDAETAMRFRADDSPLARGRMRLDSVVPVLKNRFTAWGRVERLRRRLATIGWPYAEPPPQFEPPDEVAFARQAASHADASEPLSAPALDVLSVASDMHAAIYVIQMPATTRHRQRFFSTPDWRRYRVALESRLRALNIVFVDASEWSDDADFQDTIHLGPAGAAKFTARLEQTLRK